MLSFVAFPDSEHAMEEWRPHHAHLIGQDDRTIPGSIGWVDGRVVCHTPGPDAAAMVVQYPAGGAGVLTLATTLLPADDEPYLLELELARHRVMLIYGKLEDWGMCLLPDDHPVMQAVETARVAFLEAVVACSGAGHAWTDEQATLARGALVTAIEASEQLALSQGEAQLGARYRAIERRGAAGRTDDGAQAPVIGCVVQNDVVTPALQNAVKKVADFIVSPMRWREIEPSEGRFDLSPSDRWIEWAVRAADMGVAAGPVLDFSARAVPPWLYIWEHDYESIRDFALDHAKRVVGRYRRAVTRWTAISSVNLNTGFSFTIDQMMELTRLSTRLIRKLAPSAPLLIELNHPFGEHPTHSPRSVPPFFYMELVHDAGIDVDGISIRFQMGDREAGRSARDLMTISHVLDIYSQFATPLHVTFGAPSGVVDEPPPMPPESIRASDDPPYDEPGGWWRERWTPEVQADWMARLAVIMLSKPMVRSITWHCLYDADSDPEMPLGGLIDRDGLPKPALRRLVEVRSAVTNKRIPSRRSGGGSTAPAAGEEAGS